tara:strand:+ start:309 stop:575 length:267 start_codon:yes stop_codon:yes gene_type:complete
MPFLDRKRISLVIIATLFLSLFHVHFETYKDFEPCSTCQHQETINEASPNIAVSNVVLNSANVILPLKTRDFQRNKKAKRLRAPPKLS